MNLYTVTSPKLGNLHLFAIDLNRAVHLMNVYLKFNFAEDFEYEISCVNSKELEPEARGFYNHAVALDREGMGTLSQKGWKIIQVWEHTFPE